MTGLAENCSLEECCKYANSTAAIAIQYDGASTGVKNRKQLTDMLKRYEWEK